MLNSNDLINVPKWDGYYPAIEREENSNPKNLKIHFNLCPNPNYANEEQLEFYKYFKQEFVKNNYVDVDGVIAYLFVFMYESIADYIDEIIDVNTAIKNLKLIKDNYIQYDKVKQYACNWLGDIYYYTGDYNKAWENRGVTTSETTMNIKGKLNNHYLTGSELFELTGLESTLLGKVDKNTFNDFQNYLEDYSKAMYEDKGLNLVEYKLSKLNYWEIDNEYFNQYKDNLFTESYLKNLLENYRIRIKYRNDNTLEPTTSKDKLRLFNGFPYRDYVKTANVLFADYVEIPSIFDYIVCKSLRKEFIDIFNELYPTVRLISNYGKKSKLKYNKLGR